ncbi:MAG: enoyl-CoA hydratase/isomerase family protein [Myxococcota bacterium]
MATITINRPDQLNALDPETIEQLENCFERAHNDRDVQGIVLAGAGKAFVAGADVKFFVDKMRAGRVEDIVSFAARGQKLFRRIEQSAKRVVCKLDGMALGGGAELALACHVIVATPKASMAFPETGIGIYPGLGGTQRLTRRLGKNLARYFLYTGATADATTLAALKLAWRVVDTEAIDATIARAFSDAPKQEGVDSTQCPLDLAQVAEFIGNAPVQEMLAGNMTLPGGEIYSRAVRKVCHKAPGAIERVAELTTLAVQGDLDAGLKSETDGLQAIFSHPDALEGMSALLEGRRPKFGQT